MIKTGNVDDNDEPVFGKDYRDLIMGDHDLNHIGLLVRSRKPVEKKLSDYNKFASDVNLATA